MVKTQYHAVLPQLEGISQEAEALCSLVYQFAEFDFEAIDVARCFIREAAKQSDELSIVYIASLAYMAGSIEGIRKERARRAKR